MKLYLILIFELVIWFELAGQDQYLLNPSFEGDGIDNEAPLQWSNCIPLSSPDNPPLPEILVDLPASHGQRYLSMRVRGDIANTSFANHRGVRDDVSTRLMTPLYKGIAYKLRIDLATDWEVVLFGDVTAMEPCNFRFWGGNSLCHRAELLGESGPVMHTNWETYRFCFTPKNDYSYFLLEADYLNNDTTNGIILADNLAISLASQYDTTLVMDTTLSLNSEVVLTASENLSYEWFPADGLSCTSGCRSTGVELSGNMTYYVVMQNEYGCTEFEKFILRIPDCDYVLEHFSATVTDTNVDMNSELMLEAAEAESYKWMRGSTELGISTQTLPVQITGPVTYYCECTDAMGCSFMLKYALNVNIFIPNVITPNGDGFNDLFVIDGLPENSSLTLTDRTGRIVYSTKNYMNNWPGMNLPADLAHTETYWYTLEMPGFETKKGFVLLKP